MDSGRAGGRPGGDRQGRVWPILSRAVLAAVCATGPVIALDAPSLHGYLESLQSGAFADDLDSLVAGNAFQNRLKAQWSPVPAATLDLEMRNRLILGEAARSDPGLSASLDFDPGWLDLAWVPVDEGGALLSLAVDRAYGEWNGGAWRLRVGRQRINWGMALAWNPDDWFNAYDFLDVLYPERPGSDAVRLELFPRWPVRFDLAAKADGSRRGVGALRLAWNRWETDFQALAGWYHGDAALGAGWAGNLGQAGWKGEAAGFAPADGEGPRSLAVTVTFDYTLAAGTYLAASALYNSRGGGGAGADLVQAGAAGLSLSPENLFPSTWALLAQATHPLSLILNGTLALLYAPDRETVGALPSLAFNLAQDWDLEGLAQLFAGYGHPRGWRGTGWRSEGNAFYLRLRRSF